MKKIFKGSFIYLVGGVFVLVILGIVILVLGLGKAYKKGLSDLINQPPTQELTLKKKKAIRKITITREDEAGCMEVTPDGIVRVYSECGKNLDIAARLTDPKNILKLFQIVSEADLAKYKNTGMGKVYKLMIETDTGTEVIQIVINNNTPAGLGQVVQTIEDIKGDIPRNSPTPLFSPRASARASPLITPSIVGGVVSPAPAASPAQTSGEGGYFVCSFSEGGTKKPYRVSNVVCTSEPSPVP